MLLETFRRRRSEKARRPLPDDPVPAFSSRDWADLPTFHPAIEPDFR